MANLKPGALIAGNCANAVAPNASIENLNSANLWYAQSFRYAESKTISTVAVGSIYAMAGTQALRKMTVALYTDVNGAPGVQSEAIEITNLALGWLTVTGFTTTYAANTQFWVVVKNTAVAPTVDYFAILFVNNTLLMTRASTATGPGTYGKSTNGGSTWAKTAPGGLVLEVNYSDGTLDGTMCYFTGAYTTTLLYGNNQAGIKFTSPASATLNIRQTSIFSGLYAGTPTGNLCCKIIIGATTYTANTTYAKALVGQQLFMTFLFTTDVVIPPSTVVRIVWYNDAVDSAANCYKIAHLPMRNVAASIAHMVWGGSVLCTSTDGGSTFVDTDTDVWVMWNMVADTDGEFAAPVFPLAAKVNPDQLTYGFNAEYTAAQDLPAITSVVSPDTLEGVVGTYNLAAYENARNDVLDAAKLLEGYSPKTRNTTYAGLYHEASVSEVKKSVTYGPSSTYTGTYDPSSGQTTTDSDTVLTTKAMTRQRAVTKPATRTIQPTDKEMVRTLQITKHFR